MRFTIKTDNPTQPIRIKLIWDLWDTRGSCARGKEKLNKGLNFPAYWSNTHSERRREGKGREETKGPFHSGLINLALQRNSTWTRSNFGQKLHESTSEVLLRSWWIFTTTELLENALQTVGIWKCGLIFSCGRKTFWKRSFPKTMASRKSRDFPAWVFVENKSKMTGD